MGLLTPSAGINYNFVSGVYAAATLVGLVLGACQVCLGDRASAVKDFWIVFAPFLPALLWSLPVRARWIAQQAALKSKLE